MQYRPVIELHHNAFDCTIADRAAELVARNCIHAGVVQCGSASEPCKLSDVPLASPLRVEVCGQQMEAPHLQELALGGLHGPAATTTWLKGSLDVLPVSRCAPGERPEGIGSGDFILTATPGSLYPVSSAGTVKVSFADLSVSCSFVA